MIRPSAPLPRTPIRVAAFDFAVVTTSMAEATAEHRLGSFSALQNRIAITPDADRMKVLDTLLHEILHAAWWAYGVRDSDDEERTVATLSTALTQIFRDNPDLLRFIGESVRDPEPELSSEYLTRILTDPQP